MPRFVFVYEQNGKGGGGRQTIPNQHCCIDYQLGEPTHTQTRERNREIERETDRRTDIHTYIDIR